MLSELTRGVVLHQPMLRESVLLFIVEQLCWWLELVNLMHLGPFRAA